VLVSCKRWKVARTGIEPLRDLYAAKDAREAHECIYIAAGEITDNARKFAAEKKMRLLYGAELAQLLPGVGGGRKG
jgi:restriction system protein